MDLQCSDGILALGNYAENAAVQSASSVMAIKALFIYIPVAVAVLQDRDYDVLQTG